MNQPVRYGGYMFKNNPDKLWMDTQNDFFPCDDVTALDIVIQRSFFVKQYGGAVGTVSYEIRTTLKLLVSKGATCSRHITYNQQVGRLVYDDSAYTHINRVKQLTRAQKMIVNDIREGMGRSTVPIDEN